MALLSLIAALGRSQGDPDRFVIGDKGGMPWRYAEDLKYFRRRTMGRPMLMGRTTYDSLGAPLDGRTHLVLSRSQQRAQCERVHWFSDLDEAVAEGLRRADAGGLQQAELMVIGGAEIYRQLLPRADRLYVTRIERDFVGDTFFPPVNWDDWKQEQPSEQICSGTRLRFESYVAHTAGQGAGSTPNQ